MGVCIAFPSKDILAVEYLGQKINVFIGLAGSASCPPEKLFDLYLTSGKCESALPATCQSLEMKHDILLFYFPCL